MFYHIHKNLAVNARNYTIPAGIIDDLDELGQDSIQTLLAVRAISPVALPPFEALPAPWPGRVKRLADNGITPEEFTNLPDDEIARRIHSRPYLIARWRREYYSWFMPEEQIKRFRP